MADQLIVLKKVVKMLEGIKVGYMITGSIAFNYYAVPRMTRDIDILVDISVEDIEKIFNAFEKDFYIDMNALKDAVRDLGMFNIVNFKNPVKVDFIILKKNEYERLKFSRRHRKKINGFEIFIISPEDLIISKLMWAMDSMSEIQLKDVSDIVLCVTNLDLNYLEFWVKKLELEKMYEMALK
jgi:hypothetical protein